MSLQRRRPVMGTEVYEGKRRVIEGDMIREIILFG